MQPNTVLGGRSSSRPHVPPPARSSTSVAASGRGPCVLAGWRRLRAHAGSARPLTLPLPIRRVSRLAFPALGASTAHRPRRRRRPLMRGPPARDDRTSLRRSRTRCNRAGRRRRQGLHRPAALPPPPFGATECDVAIPVEKFRDVASTARTRASSDGSARGGP